KNDEYFESEAHLFIGKIYCEQDKFELAAQHFSSALRLGDLWGITHLYQLMNQHPEALSLRDRIAILQTLILENFTDCVVTMSFVLSNSSIRIKSVKDVNPTPLKLLDQICESKNLAEYAMGLTAIGIIKTESEDHDTELAKQYFQTALKINSD